MATKGNSNKAVKPVSSAVAQAYDTQYDNMKPLSEAEIQSAIDKIVSASMSERTNWPNVVYGAKIAVIVNGKRTQDKAARAKRLIQFQTSYVAKHSDDANEESDSYKRFWKQGRDHFNRHVDKTLVAGGYKEASGGRPSGSTNTQKAQDAAKVAKLVKAVEAFNKDFGAKLNEVQAQVRAVGKAIVAFQANVSLTAEQTPHFAAIVGPATAANEAVKQTLEAWTNRAVLSATPDQALEKALKKALPGIVKGSAKTKATKGANGTSTVQ